MNLRWSLLCVVAALPGLNALGQGLSIDYLRIDAISDLNFARYDDAGVHQPGGSLSAASGYGPMLTMPYAVSATDVFASSFVSARQSPLGMNSVSVQAINELNPVGGLRLFARAETRYEIQVSTTTPDTPVRLNFHTFSGGLQGSAYYGSGDVELSLSARIGTSISSAGGSGAFWGFDEGLSLDGGSWSRTLTTWDVQGIGLPNRTVDDGWNGFRLGASTTYDPFTGTLDFGLLQPGETLTVRYIMEARASGDLDFTGSSVAASFVDPFSLGGAQPFVIENVDYSLISVPEPATWAAWLGAGALGLVIWRRRASQRG